jgi:NitT/TauT family transport system permease protein
LKKLTTLWKDVGVNMKTAIKNIRKTLFGSIAIILFFLFWEAASRYGLVPKSVIPPPTKVFTALVRSAESGELALHMKVSLARAAFGFLLASAIAIPMGFFLGTFFKTFEKALLPFLRMLEKLNPFALFPVFMIIFGIGNLEKVAIIFWVAQWPLLFNTIAGTRSIEPSMIKSARSMGANKKTLFFKVILPAAVPGIFTGVKISAQISFFMIIASEMAGSSQGLGWYYLSSSQSYQVPLMYGIILFITVLAVIINILFSKLEKHFLVWKEAAFQEN